MVGRVCCRGFDSRHSSIVYCLNGYELLVNYNNLYFKNNDFFTISDHVIAMRLRLAMNLLESVSCIRFIPIIGTPNRNESWLHISNPRLQRDCMHEPLYNGNGEVVRNYFIRRLIWHVGQMSTLIIGVPI